VGEELEKIDPRYLSGDPRENGRRASLRAEPVM